MWRKNLILITTLLILVASLTGCGQQAEPAAPAEEPSAEEEAAAPEEAEAAASEEAEAAAPAETAADEAAETTEEEPVTIVWLEHLSTEWGDEWFDEVTADFEAETGIHVERVSAPWNDLWPKMSTWAQSGEMPDVYGTWAGWTATLAEWDAMADLTPLIPELSDPEEFEANQGVMWPEIGEFDGELVMVPWWLQSYGLFYNQEAFEEKGYEVPETWDEFRALLEQIRADGDYGINMAWGVPAESGLHFGYLQWMWRALGAGGTLADASGNPAFNTPEGKLAMQYWADLYNDDLILPGSEATTVQQNRGDFCSGKTIMIIDGPWMGATCETMEADFTVAMAPGLCGEATCGNVVYPWYFTVAEDSEHKVEALRFIEYLVSDEVAADFSKTFSTALANPIRYDDPEFAAHPITGKMQELLAAEGNQALPNTLYAEEVQVMIGTEWQRVLFGEQTVDEAIESIETQWNEIVSQ
jgi:ABC-type glycerol-3-phosphate transport system substrate-binding protein